MILFSWKSVLLWVHQLKAYRGSGHYSDCSLILYAELNPDCVICENKIQFGIKHWISLIPCSHNPELAYPQVPVGSTAWPSSRPYLGCTCNLTLMNFLSIYCSPQKDWGEAFTLILCRSIRKMLLPFCVGMFSH